MFGKNILVLVPHPDDEVVACAATLTRAQELGSRVFALYLTHGCLAKETLWSWQQKHYEAYIHRRRGEAERVAAFLKIEPIGWSLRPARHLWTNLAEVYRDIAEAVRQYTIDQIWLPAYEGGNPDHDGLNAVGQSFTRQISVLEFAEYNFFTGHAQAQCFPYPDSSETLITLTEIERAKKLAALALYESERQNLSYIGTQQECFRPLAAYNYSQPPHPGKLWYERFQWVPFRHPRVDFTPSSAVSLAIGKFLSAQQQRLADKP
jgi:LmbE family N-acetylglucosaminyl deacetylase